MTVLLLLLADVPAPTTDQHSSSGAPVWLLVAVPIAVVVIGVALFYAVRSRRRARRSAPAAVEAPSRADSAPEDEHVG
jgi:heme/copper-type cytochrome/quinol oxidase subunit 2